MGRPTRNIDTDVNAFMQRDGFKVLDLCCCSGLAAEGYMRLPGVQVLGVDIVKPSYYPGTFLQADFTTLPLTFIKLFNFVHLSPPCQIYSRGTEYARQCGKQYPNYLPQARALMQSIDVPGVIENIPESGLRPDFMLCGTMFGLPQTRDRHFEAHNWQPSYKKLYCNHATHKGKHNVIVGGFKGTIHDAALSMDCYPTRLRSEIKEGFPPAYTHFILQAFINMHPVFSQLTGYLTSTPAHNNYAAS